MSFASLPWSRDTGTADPAVSTAIFFGLGSDGTVGANKNSIKIIGEETNLYAQGFFVYDSKKSGSITESHLRFGPKPIRSTYLIDAAQFVACHQWSLLSRVDVLGRAADGATFLINSPHPAEHVWAALPVDLQRQIVDKRLRLFAIDASVVAGDAGVGKRGNTVLQACFFALANVLPRDAAIAAIKRAAKKTYASKGDDVVQANFTAIDAALGGLHEVKVGRVARPPTVARRSSRP